VLEARDGLERGQPLGGRRRLSACWASTSPGSPPGSGRATVLAITSAELPVLPQARFAAALTIWWACAGL